MQKLDGHKGEVRAVAFLPDGRLVSGGADRSVRVWNLSTGEVTAKVSAKAPVYALAVDPRSGRVAFGGRSPSKTFSNAVRFFDPNRGTIVETREITIEETVPVFDRATMSFQPVTQMATRSIWALTYTSDGASLVAVFRKPGAVNEPDGAGGHWWRTGSDANGPLGWTDVYASMFAPSGSRIAHTRERRVVVAESPESDQITFEYPIQNSWASGVAFASPGKVLVAAASYLHFVDEADLKGSKKNAVKSGFRLTTSLAVTPDGQYALLGGKPSGVEVYEIASRTRVKAYDFQVGAVHALAIAPDGLTFAVGGAEGLLVCDFDL